MAIALFTATAKADESLWMALQNGGHVVLMRHALTTPGSGDPPGFKLDDCSTQRNLADEGRVHARRIGAEFQKRKIPVGRGSPAHGAAASRPRASLSGASMR